MLAQGIGKTTSVATNHFSGLSLGELQSRLKQCWLRFERAVKDEMAPLLYYLRKELKKQGSHSGEGFCNWIDKNLGISRKTANRWADEWAIAHNLKKPHTSGQMTKRDESRSDPVDHNGASPVSFQLLLDDEQETKFLAAWDNLKAAIGEDKASQLVFNAVINRAEHEERPVNSKKPVRSVGTKRRRRMVN